MVRASAILLNIVWIFCAFTNKNTLLVTVFFPVGSFCSRSECEKRKAIWDSCVAGMKHDLGQKKEFDTQMLALTNALGQYTQTD
jgi:hypothetical protein